MAQYQGVEVYVELTSAQMYGTGDEKVPAFEDRAGQLVMHEVAIRDLTEIEPE